MLFQTEGAAAHRHRRRVQLLVAVADDRLARPAEPRLEAAVDQQEPSVAVLDVDLRRRAVDDRLQQLLVAPQLRPASFKRMKSVTSSTRWMIATSSRLPRRPAC